MNDRHSTQGNRRREQDPAYGLLQPLFTNCRQVKPFHRKDAKNAKEPQRKSFFEVKRKKFDSVVFPVFFAYFASSRFNDFFYVGKPRMLNKQGSQSQEGFAALWDRGVELLRAEFAAISPESRDELVPLLAEMGRLKEKIVLLSDGADGSAVCALCNGACCRVGRYHPAPLDLLACFAAQELPVAPEFASGACPFLGSSGCRIISSRRSFTCVTFICELIEARLSATELTELARLEEELRRLRRWTADRFGGALAESFFLWMEQGERDKSAAPDSPHRRRYEPWLLK